MLWHSLELRLQWYLGKPEGVRWVQVPAATQAKHQELALEQLADLLRERDGAAEALEQAQQVNDT
jgi:hypothetical protein